MLQLQQQHHHHHQQHHHYHHHHYHHLLHFHLHLPHGLQSLTGVGIYIPNTLVDLPN
jgi:hypothetical protein